MLCPSLKFIKLISLYISEKYIYAWSKEIFIYNIFIYSYIYSNIHIFIYTLSNHEISSYVLSIYEINQVRELLSINYEATICRIFCSFNFQKLAFQSSKIRGWSSMNFAFNTNT